MIAFFILIANVYTNLKKTTRMWTRVEESVGASVRLQALLDEKEDLENALEDRDNFSLSVKYRF